MKPIKEKIKELKKNGVVTKKITSNKFIAVDPKGNTATFEKLEG